MTAVEFLHDFLYTLKTVAFLKGEMMDRDAVWQEWLNKIRYTVPDVKLSITNRDIYKDILYAMREAFEAGIDAKIKYKAEEMLQK